MTENWLFFNFSFFFFFFFFFFLFLFPRKPELSVLYGYITKHWKNRKEKYLVRNKDISCPSPM
jgi:hypothetical protein